MASTSSHFQWPGYGTSSSSVRILLIIVPLFCESTFNNICSSVVHSPPWQSLIFDITPHSIQPSSLKPPSFLPSLYLHSHRHSSYALLFSSHHMPVPVPHPILDFHCDFSHFRCLDPLIFHSLSCRAVELRISIAIFCHPTLHIFSSSSSTARRGGRNSASSSPSSSNVGPRWLFECVHSLYCLFLQMEM